MSDPTPKECRERFIPTSENYAKYVLKKINCSHSPDLKNAYIQIYQMNFLYLQSLRELIRSCESSDPEKKWEHYVRYLELDKESEPLDDLMVDVHMLETTTQKKLGKRTRRFAHEE